MKNLMQARQKQSQKAQLKRLLHVNKKWIASGNVPKVTVIMPVYNMQKFVSKAITSILQQTYKKFQFIIINDGSTDNSWRKIKCFQDSRICALNMNNRGKPASMNLGLRYSLGEYILEMDADDWLEPDAIMRLVHALNASPKDVGLAYAGIYLWLSENDKLVKIKAIKGTEYADKYEVLKSLQNHCPRLYRKSALQAVGGWTTSLYGKELRADDFFLRLKLAELFRAKSVDAVLYNKRVHKSSLTGVPNPNIMNWQIKNIVKFMLEKWGGTYAPVFHTNDSGFIWKLELIRKG
ncbi:glycosyltransferase family 2 protein [Mechercharimyces sp. CAU 1602]|nr:glycosyltransferase family 2 protein [Mechercharimyces sp. CAU 1602]